MIYLDNSATTKPFPEVLNSFVKVSSDYFGNPSSLHNFGGKAEQLLRMARITSVRNTVGKTAGDYFYIRRYGRK